MDNNLFQQQQQLQQQQQFDAQNRLFQEQQGRFQTDQQFGQWLHQIAENDRLYREQAQRNQRQPAAAPGMGGGAWAAPNSRQAVSPNQARDSGSSRHWWSRRDTFLLVVWVGVAAYFLFFRNGGVTLPW